MQGRFTYPVRQDGFMLPTVVVSGILLLMLLAASLQLASSSANALREQYYLQLAKDAAEAGLVWLQGCLRDYKRPQVGAVYVVNSQSCTNRAPDAARAKYLSKNGNVALRYEAVLRESSADAHRINSVGYVDLLRPSGDVWRTASYAHNSLLSEASLRLTKFSLRNAGLTFHFIRPDGGVWGWGYSQFGQLGGGSLNETANPVKVIDGVKKVINGYDELGLGDHREPYSLFALKHDGSVWAWGRNTYPWHPRDLEGILGDGTAVQRSSPVRVISGDVKEIFSAQLSIFALKNDNSLWGWGSNLEGKLGVGDSRLTQPSPVQIVPPGSVSVIKIIGGRWATIMLKADGTLWAWGENTYHKNSVPKQLAIPLVKDIQGDDRHIAILLRDGRVMAWRRVSESIGGFGAATLPEYMPGLVDIQKVIADRNYYGIDSRGALFGWSIDKGFNVGDGVDRRKGTPLHDIPVSPTRVIDSGVEEVFFQYGNDESGNGTYAIFALKGDGTLLGWGDNRACQLLRPDKGLIALSPLQVMSGVKKAYLGLENVRSISQFAAIKTNGDLMTWGMYPGDGDPRSTGPGYVRCEPIKVLSNVTDVYRTGLNYFALDSDTNLWSWGSEGWTGSPYLGRGPNAKGNAPGIVKLPDWRVVY